MKRLSAWWRSGAGLLAACVLTVFSAGPGLDAMAHHTHNGVEVLGHSHSEGMGLDLDHDHDHGLAHDHDHDHDGGLTNGDHDAPDHAGLAKFHTHGLAHQAVSVAVEAPPVVATARVERQAYGLALESVAVSNRHFRLIRPPRA